MSRSPRPFLFALGLFAAALPLCPRIEAAEAGRAATRAGTCAPGPTVLCLLGSRFSVEIDWQDFDTNTGAGQVLPLGSDDTGFFWFTDAEEPEIFIKVLDGTGITSFFWVFYGALTHWEYTVTVTDTVTSEQAVYFNPLGTFASVADTMALPGSRRLASPGSALGLTADAAPERIGAPAPCAPGSTVLCLDENRFRVEVDWDTGMVSGTAATMPVTDLAGYFTFFSPDNVDLMVKIIDGDDDNFWLYYGSTTNVEYTITVTEVCSGAVQTYFNPSGVFTSAADFTAFPVTPNCGPIFIDGFESGDTTAW